MSVGQLADLLEGSAPDLRLEKVLRAEAGKIRESLQVVGQYAMEWEGNLVVINPAANAGEGEGKAVRVLDAGHRYELASLDGDSGVQRLQFVKREGPKFPGNIGTNPGATSQEVLRVLIHRAGYVNDQIPCWQTRLSLYLMGLVIWLYEHRAARRHKRKAPGLHAAVWGTTCRKCGHVGCEGGCQP